MKFFGIEVKARQIPYHGAILKSGKKFVAFDLASGTDKTIYVKGRYEGGLCIVEKIGELDEFEEKPLKNKRAEAWRRMKKYLDEEAIGL